MNVKQLKSYGPCSVPQPLLVGPIVGDSKEDTLDDSLVAQEEKQAELCRGRTNVTPQRRTMREGIM